MITPWIQLAATLAQHGLSGLADRVRKSPGKVVQDIAAALSDPANTVPATPAAIETAIASDPEAIAKLAAVELEVFAAEEDSRAAAREAWSGSWVMGFTATFALAVLAIFGAALWYLANGEVRNPAEFGAQLKVLEYVLVAVVSFFFGSSVGSKRKGALDR